MIPAASRGRRKPMNERIEKTITLLLDKIDELAKSNPIVSIDISELAAAVNKLAGAKDTSYFTQLP
jgi:uncharacterized linocin/CFP29 family protein